MGEYAIILKNVYKKFDSNEKNSGYALKDINLKIRKGEVIGIIGANGSGKTTLLKVIAGILKPTKGLVKVDGKVLPLLQLGAGFNPELTGRENVKLNSVLLEVSNNKISERLQQVIEFSGLEDAIDKQLRTYSTGMIMRLAFSTFLLSDFKILLIDEAISVGDVIFQKKSFDLIRSMKECSKTIILVSHSMQHIINICDKTVYLEKGKMIAYGSTESVVQKYLRRANAKNRADFLKKWNDKKVELESLKKREAQIDNLLKKHNKRRLDFIIQWKLKKSLIEVRTRIESFSQWIFENGENERADLNLKLRRIEEQIKELTKNNNKNPQIKKLIKKKKKTLKELDNNLTTQLKTEPTPEKREEILTNLKRVLFEEVLLLKNTKEEITFLKRYKELIETEFNYEDERIKAEMNYIKDRLFLIESIADIKTQKWADDNFLEELKIGSNENLMEDINHTAEILRLNTIKIEEKIITLKQRIEGQKLDKNALLKKQISMLEKKREEIIQKIQKIKEKTNMKKTGSDVKITKIRLLEMGKEKHQLTESQIFSTGQPFIIEITYNAKKEIKKPVFGIAIYRDDGILIYGPNTKFHKFPIEKILGKGKIIFKIKELPLLQGKYFITVAIHTAEDFLPFDISDRIINFKVESKKKEYGIIHINADWEHKK